MDNDGYPTDEELEECAKLDPTGDPQGFVDFFREHWHWPERVQLCVTLEVATGGWSGNEEVIAALKQSMFWLQCWQRSERGGKYVFDLKQLMRENETIDKIEENE